MVPKKEIILTIVGSYPSELKLTYTTIHKLVYLVNKELKTKLGEDMGYSFDSFMSHTGPYDKELQDDLDTWLLIGLLKNQNIPYSSSAPSPEVSSHNVRLTDLGASFLQTKGASRLANAFGGKYELESLRHFVVEHSREGEDGLINEASSKWINDHPEELKAREFFPSLAKSG